MTARRWLRRWWRGYVDTSALVADVPAAAVVTRVVAG
ncbi:hypothetical protein SAMN05443575_0695 [Jatrophihabitans endophyticus]|uniref:Uncharacterized protein n=1 Tax=Jatrophihabitans endophyticus TaxID=1206085 RepID=A0A1M5DTV1_9ACTN|nr:hypothetical protein SAMN05443575_0695 [Jatrophihabitans endophyticus]